MILARYLSICLATLVSLGAAGADAAQWTVDPAKSSIGFTGTQTGASFTGHFSSFTASIDFDPANPTGGHVSVKINTCSAATGDPQRDSAMPGADWFNCAAMPSATYSATSFKALGTGKFEAIGSLTIRGITKPLNLPFTLVQTGKTATATSEVTLIRTDYGVGQGAWSSGQWVGLNVTVNIVLVATQP